MANQSRFKRRILLGNIELTKKQKDFFKIMKDPETKVVFLHGCSGTGKSLLAFYTALSLWNDDNNLNVKYLRSPVESAERSIGFLKGNLNQKASVYNQIYEDKLSFLLNKQERDYVERKGGLETDLVNFIRGQDWMNMVVILEEAQNCSKGELKTVLTRLNKNSKIFLCGDTKQSDIRNSGFANFIGVFENEESKQHGIHCLEFTQEDIMRDKVISFILSKVEDI